MKNLTLLCFQRLALAFLILSIAVPVTSCRTTSDPEDVTFRQPASPIDGAVMMQDRLGQINRSLVR